MLRTTVDNAMLLASELGVDRRTPAPLRRRTALASALLMRPRLPVTGACRERAIRFSVAARATRGRVSRNPPQKKERGEESRRSPRAQVVGEYGLKNKREVWRVQYALAKIRTAARHLLTLDEKDDARMRHAYSFFPKDEILGFSNPGREE